jgi:hypothetical protein
MKKHIGQKVYVFKEIKQGIWTVWNKEKTQKLFWTKSLTLINAHFFVDQEKREKVLDTGKRFPHAGVFGTLVNLDPENQAGTEIYYNPFTTQSFEKRKAKTRVNKASRVVFSQDGRVFGINLRA